MKFDDWVSKYYNESWPSNIRTLDVVELKQWVDKKYPWALYVIEIDAWLNHSTRTSVNNWCEQNLIGKYNIDIISYFELEEDSVLFALRWS